MPSEPRVVPVPCRFGAAQSIVYVYYIDAPEPALVDTGVAGSAQDAIEPALNAVGLSLANVRWLLATHGHWDHIGGAHEARSMAAPGASVVLHEADEPLLRSRRLHMERHGYQALRFEFLDDAAALAEHDAVVMQGLSGEFAADRTLHGGERISLGGDVVVEAVHTPGHSPGSMTFVMHRTEWAFTGDSVQVAGSAGVPLYTNPVTYGRSQRRLLEDVKPDRLHMGHHFRNAAGQPNPSVIDGRSAVDAALRDSIAVHERMVQAAASVGSMDLDQPRAEAVVSAAVAMGLPADEPANWPASFFTTLYGHLAARSATAS